MIISRTPLRMSLFGGGTDYPTWFLKHGGSVIGSTIDKYCHITLRALPPFFEHKHRIVYSKIELVTDLDEIQHPAVRGTLKEFGINKGLEIHYDADLPARSGLGSSSAFTVGLINALHAHFGRMRSKTELANEAIHLEQDVFKEAVGCQDQIWAAFGGLNRIDFRTDGRFSVQPLLLTQQRRADLESSILLFFTGFARFASEIAAKQIANFDKRQVHLLTIQGAVDEAFKVLKNPDAPITELGHIMHESWQMKRALASEVSTPEIDEIYQAGLDAGAVGGKLLGAGGGGFVAFLVPKHKRKAVKERLKKLITVSFRFEDRGSHIAMYEPGAPENGDA
ncbi:MAG: kinase [Alphaproteobacteria bacterium RIFOXYD12_FULL_60_8]|nr:MAG: kinase [Alphaproteobacteria bacterium RIFOXYD12_FULL_60_8]